MDLFHIDFELYILMLVTRRLPAFFKDETIFSWYFSKELILY